MPVTQYKRAEKQFADRVGVFLRRGRMRFLTFLRLIVQKGRQRFTVMLIPHSEKKIFNFQISFFTLVFILSLQALVLVGFVMLATHFTYTNEKYTAASAQLGENESLLTGFKDEMASIRPQKRKFEGEMAEVMKLIGLAGYAETGQGGLVLPPEEVPGTEEAAGMRELSDLRSLDTLIRNSQSALEAAVKLMAVYNNWVADSPTRWPLKGPYGNITTRFGWTTQPITNRQQLHTGIDIAYQAGVPVVATGNGIVTQAGYNQDLGVYVQISHKYGFATRYGHLSTYIVSPGQKVKQGDVIGYLGNTGEMTTGPHVHYEIRLGIDYIDPMEFGLMKREPAGSKLGGAGGE